MSDIHLEAEQIVGEEEEEAPKRRSLTMNRRNVLIVLVGLIVGEALLLFVVFEAIRGDPQIADALAKGKPASSVKGELVDSFPIEVGDVSIWDPSDPGPRANRRFSASFTVVIDKDTQQQIDEALVINPNAVELVKKALAKQIRNCMLSVGGDMLSNMDMQLKFEDKLRDYLNDQLPTLRNHILKVHMENFRPGRY